MTDAYDYWRGRLRGENPPLALGEVHAGFWRTRISRGDPKMVGVATWVNAMGYPMVQIDRDSPRMSTADFAEGRFSFIAKNPVSEENYRTWLRTGAWQDLVPTRENDPMADDGSNAGEEKTEFDKINLDLDTEDLEIAQFLKQPVTTQEQADRATNWSNALQKIEARRERAFKVEKDPTLAASRAVDTKWNPAKKKIADLREKLRAHQSPFLIAQADAARARQKEADDARKAAFDAGQPAPPKPVATVKSGSAGGRTTRVVEVWSGKITDMDACVAALKTHPDFLRCVQELADRAAKANVPLAGVERVSTMETKG